MSRLYRNIVRRVGNNPISGFLRALFYYIKYHAIVHPNAIISTKITVNLGYHAVIRENCRIENTDSGKFKLGSNAWLAPNVLIQPGIINIGEGTTIQEYSRIIGEVNIGRECILAPNVYISSGTHQYNLIPDMTIHDQDILVKTSHKGKNRNYNQINVHDDCWLGINVVVMPGVTIGRGAVIGANSVVNRDIEPYTIVAGAPASIRKKRIEFDPPEKLNAEAIDNIRYFYSGFTLSKEQMQKEGREHGALIAENIFILAMRPKIKSNDIKVAITLRKRIPDMASQYIVHEGQKKEIMEEKKEYVFKTRYMEDNLYRFNVVDNYEGHDGILFISAYLT